MTPEIDRLDHLVLTVSDIDATCDFYEKVLGARRVTYGKDRNAISFGRLKLNLHPKGGPIEPHAAHPTTGSADICLITTTPITLLAEHLLSCGVRVEEGPVERVGARTPLRSLYIRDPDGNLVEISNEI